MDGGSRVIDESLHAFQSFLAVEAVVRITSTPFLGHKVPCLPPCLLPMWMQWWKGVASMRLKCKVENFVECTEGS